MDLSKPAFGILCGGGPAPGLNGVIAAVTIEAQNNGYNVFGFLEGFKWLMEGDSEHVVPLQIKDVSRIHFMGGSILRTSRSNPTQSQKSLANTVAVLKKFNVNFLVTIGGDDTAFSSMTIANYSNGDIKVCHVPKTIDNDLPLPQGIPTFGYQTAREFGSQIIHNLMEDAKTASRYFIVIAMGRTAGHLALGIGKSAGAHLTLIPEEFVQEGKKITFDAILDNIEGTIIKRKKHNKDHGVIILAEGLLEHMDKADLQSAFGEQLQIDPHGHVLLAELDFGKQIRDEMRKRIKNYGWKIGFTEKNLGYELRCAPPNAFDREYTRDLGYGAARFLLEGGNKALITVQGGQMVPLSFDDLKDPKTGKTRVRLVDTKGEGFSVAQNYMIRLKEKDFSADDRVESLAQVVKMSVEDFKKRFQYLVESPQTTGTKTE